MLALALTCLLCAGVPCVVFCVNLRRYLPPPAHAGPLPAASILIPARNEAGAIAAAVQAALSSTGMDFEVVVMDDSSTDGTDRIVRQIAATDTRLRLEQAPPLPAGWNGKQHACWALAHAARNPVLCFVDADVRLEPECLSRMTAFLVSAANGGQNGLVSGFPRQLTGTPLEWLLLPLIHFVLLGFLPLARMRAGTDPAFAAGCGQFLLCDRAAYFQSGGHGGIKLTMHDGLRLPRLFREQGHRTDLADITAYARCRMYTNAAQTWSGLAKNATEGIAAPARIVPISIILLLGQVLPFIALAVYIFMAGAALFDASTHHTFVFGVSQFGWMLFLLTGVTTLLAWLPRWLAAARFRQDKRSAFLHPIGIVTLLAIQWHALIRKLRKAPVSWRDRAYTGN